MALNEGFDLSPISRRATETSSTSKHKEQRTQVPSSMEMIPITFKSMPSVLAVRSPKIKHTSDNDLEPNHVSTRINLSIVESTLIKMSGRLKARKVLNKRLALVSDAMCVLGMLGIVLMIIENELKFHRVGDDNSKECWFIKLVITISTAMLLVLVCYYHVLDLKYYANQNGIARWSVRLTKTKLCFIIAELLICAIHPMPRSSLQASNIQLDSNSTTYDADASQVTVLSYTETDVGLGLPMFIRIYLLARSIMFHSYLVRDASARSIGYLNQTPINFFFLVKTYLEQWPVSCLLACCTLLFFIGSWCLRACDYNSNGDHVYLTDAMWLFMVTFTTVGYGDLYPTTHCGRCIAAMVGILGVLVSSLFVAILTQKLLLTREEKYVHTFVLNTELAKHRLNEAANVAKFAIQLWFMKRKNKNNPAQVYRVQQNLYRSIHNLKENKRHRRGLIDNCVGVHELMGIQRTTSDQTTETVKQIMEIKGDINKIEEKLNNMNRNMETLQNTLNLLMDKIAK